MRRVVKLIVLLIAAIVVIVHARPARADDFAELEKARNPYDAGRYEEAVGRFRELVDPSSDKRIQDPWLLERARMYLAASLMATGHEKDADTEIEAILRQNPAAVPDAVFPTQMLDRFTDVRSRIRGELEQKAREKLEAEQAKQREAEKLKQRERERIAELERLAAQEVHVEHNERWIALVPFGVGQFQNDQQALGWTFLGAETALAVTSIVSYTTEKSLESQGTRPNVDTVALNDRVATWTKINRLSFLAFAVVAAGGVAHAQLTFVPERRETRKRPIPPPVQIAPSASALDRGAVLGIQGVF